MFKDLHNCHELVTVLHFEAFSALPPHPMTISSSFSRREFLRAAAIDNALRLELQIELAKRTSPQDTKKLARLFRILSHLHEIIASLERELFSRGQNLVWISGLGRGADLTARSFDEDGLYEIPATLIAAR
jgi:hypothetical protein